MLDFFKEFIKERENYIASNLNNYVQVTAGTPAMYISLALNFMEYPVKYYYIDRKSAKAFEVNTFSFLYKSKYLLVLRNLIDSYNYKASIDILKSSPFRHYHDISLVLKILFHMRNFNFKAAFENFRDLNPKLQKELSYLGERISNCLESKEKRILLMRELFELYLKNKEYVESVAILFGIIDNYTRDLVERMYNIKIEKNEYGEFEEFNRLCQKYEYKGKLDSTILKWKDRPTLPLLKRLITFKMHEAEYKEIINSYFELVKFVDNSDLRRIRNLGLFAHGTVGITEEYIDSLNRVKVLLRKVIPPEGEIDNIFDKTNEKIISILAGEIGEI